MVHREDHSQPVALDSRTSPVHAGDFYFDAAGVRKASQSVERSAFDETSVERLDNGSYRRSSTISVTRRIFNRIRAIPAALC